MTWKLRGTHIRTGRIKSTPQGNEYDLGLRVNEKAEDIEHMLLRGGMIKRPVINC